MSKKKHSGIEGLAEVKKNPIQVNAAEETGPAVTSSRSKMTSNAPATNHVNQSDRTAVNRKDAPDFMQAAIELAKMAGKRGDIPIGAVVVKDGTIVGVGWNSREKDQSVAGHAELMALEDACHNLNSWRLDGCDLYVTLEPCLMCFGALQNARIRKVYFGAYDPKAGAVCSKWHLADLSDLNHRVQWEGGLDEESCRSLLKEFFRHLRRRNKALNQKNGGRGMRKKLLSKGAPLKRLN